jgi:hypothetical protein
MATASIPLELPVIALIQSMPAESSNLSSVAPKKSQERSDATDWQCCQCHATRTASTSAHKEPEKSEGRRAKGERRTRELARRPSGTRHVLYVLPLALKSPRQESESMTDERTAIRASSLECHSITAGIRRPLKSHLETLPADRDAQFKALRRARSAEHDYLPRSVVEFR